MREKKTVQKVIRKEIVALLFHIQEVSGSNLGLETSRSDRISFIFLCLSRQIRGWHMELDNDSILPHPSQFIIIAIIRRCIN
jgi:hypothetical protein